MTYLWARKEDSNRGREVGPVLGKILVQNPKKWVGSRLYLALEQRMVVVAEGMHRSEEEDSKLWQRNRACAWQDIGVEFKRNKLA